VRRLTTELLVTLARAHFYILSGWLGKEEILSFDLTSRNENKEELNINIVDY